VSELMNDPSPDRPAAEKPAEAGPRRVRLLPDQLINRIAAGEVVERPAAVLKELLENSLDAGADRLEIEILDGGKKLIRVRDNGRGMDRDDLYMSLERHATSKLEPIIDNDLSRIETLGFRGEALPSIAAVSSLSITSAAADGQGHVLKVRGGIHQSLAPAPANRGTTVEVADLFRNVPARRKFLKSAQTESGHLLAVAQSYALSRPDVSLSFRDNGRELLSVEARHDFPTRVYRVMGRETAESLRPFEHQSGGLKLSGWLGAPERSLHGKSHIFAYVSGRPIRDRLIHRALAEGYGRLLPAGQWPAAVVFIELDPEEVDVNVHPAKAEVRFKDPNFVFGNLSRAVARALGRNQAIPPVRPPEPADFPTPGQGPPGLWPDPPPRAGGGPEPARRPEPAAPPPWLWPSPARPPAEGSGPAPEPAGPDLEQPGAGPEERPERSTQADLAGLRPLAQLYDSYILAQGQRGLYLIDQHAGHERIIYNQLKDRLAREGLPGQKRLFADSRELSPREALAAEKLIPHLDRLGFDLSPFGERSFILKAAPAILGDQDPWPPLMEILGTVEGRLRGLEGAGLSESLERLSNSWLYSLACRAAIKAGRRLSLEEMESLLSEMAVTPHGAFCPHGRRSVQLIDRHWIEKNFDRA
jgi:DNA mismatch repair protein MutL